MYQKMKRPKILLAAAVLIAVVFTGGFFAVRSTFKEGADHLAGAGDTALTQNEWKRSMDQEVTFKAVIETIRDQSMTVCGLETNEENNRGAFDFATDGIAVFGSDGLSTDLEDLRVGDTLSVTYKGGVLETYPVKIPEVTKIQLLNEQNPSPPE